MAEHPALYTAHCPNGPTYCCELHAREIRGLFAFMGCHIGFTPAPDNAECANCVNTVKAASSAANGGVPGTLEDKHG